MTVTPIRSEGTPDGVDSSGVPTFAQQMQAMAEGYGSRLQALVDLIRRGYLRKLGQLHAARVILGLHTAVSERVWNPILDKELEYAKSLTPSFAALSLKLRAVLYGVFFVFDLLTIHAIFARADFPDADAWSMIGGITGVLMALPSLLGYAWLSARNSSDEVLAAARRKLTHIFAVVAVVSLLLIPLGLAGLAAIAVNDDFDHPGLFSLSTGLLFLGALLGLPAASACLSCYAYASGAASWAQARAAVMVTKRRLEGGLLIRLARRTEARTSAQLRALHERALLRAALGPTLAIKEALAPAAASGQDPANLTTTAAGAFHVPTDSPGLANLNRLVGPIAGAGDDALVRDDDRRQDDRDDGGAA